MVICDRPVIEVCPVEWGRMDKRSVLQWDKDDCAAAGSGEVRPARPRHAQSALHYAVDLIREHRGYEVDLATIPQEDDVYAMLCRADTVGVFQIESRAQMATLPRLKPRRFYDLVVEVALIRPGPIQGGSVHPYIRRRNGQEPVTYLHPLLENCLGKTLGVPLFQEQLMQMAIDVAGFTPSEADQLRQAMGSKRSRARMEKLKARLYDGMAERNITGDVADEIFMKMAAFANYGFPESHTCQLLVPRLRLVVDQVPRTGGVLRGVAQRPADGFLEPALAGAGRAASRRGGALARPQRVAGDGHAGAVRASRSATSRCGWASARCAVSAPTWPTEIEAGRPYESIEDLVRRVPHAQLRCSSRRWPRPGCSSECFGLRASRGAVGGRRRRAVAARSAGGHRHRRDVAHACRAWIRWRPPSPICGQPAWRPTAIPRSSCATQLDRHGVVTAVGSVGLPSRRARCWWPASSPIASGR